MHIKYTFSLSASLFNILLYNISPPYAYTSHKMADPTDADAAAARKAKAAEERRRLAEARKKKVL